VEIKIGTGCEAEELEQGWRKAAAIPRMQKPPTPTGAVSVRRFIRRRLFPQVQPRGLNSMREYKRIDRTFWDDVHSSVPRDA
jgi:hypothetical protein